MHTFTVLDSAHTDVCEDMGNEAAIHLHMNMLGSGSRLQGACCAPMDLDKYASQINGLRRYAYISAVPQNPYDVSVTSAQGMLAYYDDIQLSASQQSVFDNAQTMTADKGWCCCQCWAWYTHAGLAKYLITKQRFDATQVVEVTNLEDCCGGA